MRQDCILTNALICRPPNNASPTDKQLGYCQPNLSQTIKKYEPDIIIPMGGSATKAVLDLTYDKGDSSITKWAGWRIPSSKLNAWICPTFHPSYVMREKRDKNMVPVIYFHDHLKAAVALRGKPWSSATGPDYKSWVEVITDTDKAARNLRKMISLGGNIAFDLETNRLKPDHKLSEIVTASVCWNGSKTIAFPWDGEAVEAMKELLRSPLGKIAHNMKFEDRWIRATQKITVKNWIHDSMQTAHVLDNRRGITGLKFQAFVLLGQATYNDHVASYLESSNDDGFNRIREADLHELLLYNGLDSLLTFMVARIQSRLLGRDIIR
jgi:hypothetical protein